MKVTPTNTSNSNTSARIRSAPRRVLNHSNKVGTVGAGVRHDDVQYGDDEIQLVFQSSQQSSLGPASRSVSNVETLDSKDDTKTTADITVYREMI
jgi:hypothetical protein